MLKDEKLEVIFFAGKMSGRNIMSASWQNDLIFLNEIQAKNKIKKTKLSLRFHGAFPVFVPKMVEFIMATEFPLTQKTARTKMKKWK